MYVLVRDNGDYVTPKGSKHSYTRNMEEAQCFSTREAAELDRCVDNERIVPVINCFRNSLKP